MRGLALEGGGARGAYHIGVMKAYLESGYEFDGFVGTSIGAINAAMLAQGDFEKALELWENISMEQVFDADEQMIFHLMGAFEFRHDRKSLSRTRKAITKIIKGRGMDTTKIKSFLETYIDEDKIRKSGKDFGLVTVSMTELKPYELMLEDIPKGKLINYIMASATVPGFQPETIEGKKFLDGALYNNCPVNLLVRKGYGKIIAVRTKSPGVLKRIKGNAEVLTVAPSRSLGNLLSFSQALSEANIGLGYHDALCAIKS